MCCGWGDTFPSLWIHLYGNVALFNYYMVLHLPRGEIRQQQ